MGQKAKRELEDYRMLAAKLDQDAIRDVGPTAIDDITVTAAAEPPNDQRVIHGRTINPELWHNREDGCRKALMNLEGRREKILERLQKAARDTHGELSKEDARDSTFTPELAPYTKFLGKLRDSKRAAAERARRARLSKAQVAAGKMRTRLGRQQDHNDSTEQAEVDKMMASNRDMLLKFLQRIVKEKKAPKHFAKEAYRDMLLESHGGRELELAEELTIRWGLKISLFKTGFASLPLYCVDPLNPPEGPHCSGRVVSRVEREIRSNTTDPAIILKATLEFAEESKRTVDKFPEATGKMLSTRVRFIEAARG